MRNIKDFVDKIFELDLQEDSDLDPLTLVNLILHRDARHSGYNWGRPFAQTTPQKVLHVSGEQPPTTFMHEAKEEQSEQAGAAGGQNNVVNQPPPKDGKIQTLTGEVIEFEANKKDPNVFSSFPQVNNCPAYFMKDMQSAPICRITGRVCIYMNPEYKNCPLYNQYASSSDPTLWEISPGKEQTYSYITGQRM